MAAAGNAHRRRRSASSTFVSLTVVVLTCGSAFLSSSQAASSAASPCSSHTFSGNGGGRLYASCADLPHLGATLHYNYTAATNTVSVAFRAPTQSGDEGGWVAWGINPSGRAGMVGTNAVVAFRRTNGTLAAYPTVLDSYAPSMAPAAPGDMTFPVSGVAAEHDVEGKEMVVYATVALPEGKGSKFTQVWQRGNTVVNDVPAAHPTTGDNVLSTATIDFSD